MRICVLGGGIIGATSTLRLLQRFPEASVDVVAHEFSPSTTSDQVAGWWEPHLDPFTSKENVLKWSMDTYSLLCQVWFRPNECPELAQLSSAMSFMSAFQFWSMHSREFDEKPIWADHVLDFHMLNRRDLAAMGRDTKLDRGFSYSSFTLEPRLALPILYDLARRRGANFAEPRRVHGLSELVHGGYDVVINCCGVGGKELCGDDDIRPVRGHVLRVAAPGQHHMMADLEKGTYIIPTRNHALLGSIDLPDTWSVTARPGEREQLIRRGVELCPSLESAPVVRQFVGLRPLRAKGVRLEAEKASNGTIIIHNYGHGGSGITLSWGCAGEVADLVVKSVAKGNKQRAKL